MKLRSPLIALAAVILALPAFAQEDGDSLTLFERTEQPEPARSQPSTPRQNQERNREPAFTLKGTSRFGDQYSTSLLNRNGETVRVKWRKGSAAGVPGFRGFEVVSVGARTVSLRLPESESCVASEAKGVSCSSSNNVALLSLTTAEAIQTRQAESREPAVEGDVQPAEGENVVINPFTGEPQVVPEISEEERQARAARAERRRQALQNFQPVRIPDDEVPAGMRKVSTPFGDRLVPIEN